MPFDGLICKTSVLHGDEQILSFLRRVRIIGIWNMEAFFCSHDVRLLFGISKKIWEIIWVGLNISLRRTELIRIHIDML